MKSTKSLLDKLSISDKKVAEYLRSFDDDINTFKKQLNEEVSIATIDEVNKKLEDFKKNIDVTPLLDSLTKMEAAFKQDTQALYDELQSKTLELSTADESRTKGLKSSISTLQSKIAGLEATFKSDVAEIRKSMPDMSDLEDRVSELTMTLDSRVTALEDEEPQEVKDWTETINKLRGEVMNRINNIGGGAMNRKVTFGGVDYLTRYTDINYKAGSNVTFTVANNNATKMVDVTIAATGGGGGGMVRSINNIAISTAAGSASGTDYVYLCTGTLTLTLPDATASNTNLYTVKNVGTGVVTIDTTSAQTIDGSPTVIMPVQYTSVDLISDTANWDIT